MRAGGWEVVGNQVHFHPGQRPKGKQVYLDSQQGGVGRPGPVRGGDEGRVLHQQWGGEWPQVPPTHSCVMMRRQHT